MGSVQNAMIFHLSNVQLAMCLWADFIGTQHIYTISVKVTLGLFVLLMRLPSGTLCGGAVVFGGWAGGAGWWGGLVGGGWVGG